MKKSLLNIMLAMTGIIVMTVGAGFALSKPAPAADTVAALQASGMTCGSCAAKIEAALRAEQGVDSVQVDVQRGMVLVAFNSQTVNAEDLAGKVTAAGYRSAVMSVVTMDQYKAITGAGAQSSPSGRSQGGCGGDCCNKVKK